MLQLKKFPDIPISTREEARESRPHSEEPHVRLLAREEGPFPAWSGKNSRVPVASQEQALSTGKARGTPGSCHHSLSPPDVSVHSREICFPFTASTLKPRIDSHHSGTRESPVGSLVGKRHGKVYRESHRSLDPRNGKRETAATAREEITRACPLS